MTDIYDNTNDDIKITLEHIEHGLCVLLSAYVRQRNEPVGINEVWSRSIATISEISIGKQAKLLELCEDPIRYALREAIEELASHLNEHYSKESGHLNNWDKMSDSLLRIADMSDCDSEAIEIYADKIFDGIGGWMA